MSPWIPVLTQTIIGLLSIVGSGVVVHKLNARKDETEFIRTKLEALFVAVQQFDQLFGTGMSYWIASMLGEIPYEQVAARYLDETKGMPDMHATAQMLVSLYFPELKEKFQTMRTTSDQTTTIQHKFRAAVGRGEDTRPFVGPFTESIKSFHKTAVDLKESICEHGKKFSRRELRRFRSS
jgi:hypothetical protein